MVILASIVVSWVGSWNRGLRSPNGYWLLDFDARAAYLANPGPRLFRGAMILRLERGRILSCRWKSNDTVIIELEPGSVVPIEFNRERVAGIHVEFVFASKRR